MKKGFKIQFIILFILFSPLTLFGENGIEKILYVSYQPGNSEIYIMNPDGTDQIDLTNNDHHDVLPHFSPAYKRIVYFCHEEQAIKTMNLDGSDKTILFKSKHPINYPRCSADGKKIAYMGFTEELSSSNIYILDLSTNEFKQITAYNYYSGLPEWSPDGKQIAYVANPDGQIGLFIMDLDSRIQKSLVTMTKNIHALELLSISWSPDGEKLAFTMEVNGIFNICVINSNGENLINLTKSNDFHNYAPSWSPCGTKIAFVSMQEGKDDIYIMNSDGTHTNKITSGDANNKYPIWVTVVK